MDVLIKTGVKSSFSLPGSPGAVNLGCKCSVQENYAGRGRQTQIVDPNKFLVFLINDNCELHWIKPQKHMQKGAPVTG